ncbi:MAG: 30S ribosomal protein S17e [Candidatus Woesearchaeota archaeon]
MGRIKTKQIKAKTRDFLESHPEHFNTDFEKNKEQLKEIAEFRSKKMRNAVAGYMVRKKKAE